MVYSSDVSTLLEDGLNKVINGDTTFNEIMTLIELDDESNFNNNVNFKSSMKQARTSNTEYASNDNSNYISNNTINTQANTQNNIPTNTEKNITLNQQLLNNENIAQTKPIENLNI